MRKNQYQSELKKLGLKIKELRKEKGLSQAQLAADCNVEISQISRIERGLLNTGVVQLFLIADCLDIKTKDIFDFEEDNKD